MTDSTDEFDRRLQAMQRSGNVPPGEETAAINAYERLRTARAIALSLLTKPTNADVLAVFAVLAAPASTSTTRGRKA